MQKSTSTDIESSHAPASNNLEYDFVEDLKRTKANISLFKLMKLPQIQENFIKTLQDHPQTKEKILILETPRKRENLPRMHILEQILSKGQSIVNSSLMEKGQSLPLLSY
jgi:hypothetical protein